MVKGKITMYRIIFLYASWIFWLKKKKKKNRISIAIFPKKKKKKKKSVALSFFGKSLWDKPFFFFGLILWWYPEIIHFATFFPPLFFHRGMVILWLYLPFNHFFRNYLIALLFHYYFVFHDCMSIILEK